MAIAKWHSSIRVFSIASLDVGTVQRAVVLLVAAVLLLVEGYRCPKIDVRNNATELAQLENCTVIAGSLTIVLIENDNSSTFEQYSFPQLKEITGYLVFYRVLGIKSLAKLFPNLTVIRGQQLVANYAFMIFEMPDLQEIGFQSLIRIQHGFVVIHRCPLLCYTHAIDWEAVTFDDESNVVGSRRANLIQRDEPEGCPTINSCRGCDPKHCWNSMHCQKFEDSHSTNGEIKCHALCLGGCINDTAAGCFLCLGPSDNGVCIEKCPSHKFLSLETNTCVNAEYCQRTSMIPINGECRKSCPSGYNNWNVTTEKFDHRKCYKCKKKCARVCPGMEIVYLADTEPLRGCNIINGSLFLRLDVEFFGTHDQLERNLGDIEEIRGALRIYRSPAISSLTFFKSLKKINPSSPQEFVSGIYAVHVAGNANLYQLWDWTDKEAISIVKGAIAFHFNPKLCVEEIDALQQHLKYNNSGDFIGYVTNGYEESCQFSGINATAEVNSYHNVTVIWKQFDLKPDRKLMGYFVYFIESPFQNVTYFSGVDACSPHSWQSKFLPNFDANTILGPDNRYRFNLDDLRGNTQYAYYVKTQVSVKSEDKILNITQGQSDIQYFHTLPHRPVAPFVTTLTKASDSITLTWYRASWDDRPYIEHYTANVYVLLDPPELMDRRDYCREPKQPEVSNNVPYHIEEATVQTHELCCKIKADNAPSRKAFIGLDGANETCGEDDPGCTLRYGYNIEFDQLRRSFGHSLPGAPTIREIDYIDFPLPRYLRPNNARDHSASSSSTSLKPMQAQYQHYLFQRNISNMTSHYIIDQLQPYTLYAVHFYACNSVSGCSSYFVHTERTDTNKDGDNVDVIVSSDLVQYNTVHLRIAPPSMPNGLTLAYEIERHLPTGERIVECITRKRHEMKSNSLTLYRLQDGSHSIRVRSISLGADGAWSKYHNFDLTKPVLLSSGTIIVLSIVGILIVIVAAIVLAFVVYKMCRAANRNPVYPMPELEMADLGAEADVMADDGVTDRQGTSEIVVADVHVLHEDLPRPFVFDREPDDYSPGECQDDLALIQQQ